MPHYIRTNLFVLLKNSRLRVSGGHLAADVGVHQFAGAGEEEAADAERQAEADAAGDAAAGQRRQLGGLATSKTQETGHRYRNPYYHVKLIQRFPVYISKFLKPGKGAFPDYEHLAAVINIWVQLAVA